mmetsp:Transcript_15885/g.42024  ORF Transcript_15885/g.42024 Transcript_15885/m.42024 type:complete len:420 (-) Transcript_15885:112-1371(-)
MDDGSARKGAPPPTSLTDAEARSIDTVIFLDVDGVLNVGMQDGDGPLVLNETNLDIMKQAQGVEMTERSRIAFEKLAAIAQQRDFAEFVTSTTWQVSDKLMGHFASIITMAGEHVAVVLSSSWRKEHHADKVLRLQEDISKHLGRPFAFSAKTHIRPESDAADRLEVIGDFLVELSNQRNGMTQPLQVLVLEDFFITGMDGWLCNGVCMNSVADAEGYFHLRVGDSASCAVQVKIVHCFDQWTTPTGLEVKVGGGLTLQRVAEAVDFLLSGRTESKEQDQSCRVADKPARGGSDGSKTNPPRHKTAPYDYPRSASPQLTPTSSRPSPWLPVAATTEAAPSGRGHRRKQPKKVTDEWEEDFGSEASPPRVFAMGHAEREADEVSEGTSREDGQERQGIWFSSCGSPIWQGCRPGCKSLYI